MSHLKCCIDASKNLNSAFYKYEYGDINTHSVVGETIL